MSWRSVAVVRAKLRELGRAFDDGFALPEPDRTSQAVLLLGVRTGHAQFAVQIADLAGVHPSGWVARLPGGPPGLLGLAGVRGKLRAVYHLGHLLGVKSAAEAPRWLLLARYGEGVAFAVDEVDAHLRAQADEIIPREGARPGERVGWVLEQGTRRLAVLDIGSLLSTIEQGAARGPRVR
ncbi:chemotaxis protein CheW [Chondromyces apiculatus]|uniref:CheW-like domain-containing protein n=1 Tax=Chondromyces apiculatus DSM 436 TaxID=1192034 RepID=A0A017SWR1_9BACT|nr:chemotaxis protein CheW [Chondromyces apiculatus]EYF01025.1 Hypothetical protein CAP_8812 [Chondromyces apiculatus DSM 436]